jgi:hypothetical protein
MRTSRPPCNPTLTWGKNWDSVKEWKEESRYPRTMKAEAEKLHKAITDKVHGVLSWLKLRW